MTPRFVPPAMAFTQSLDTRKPDIWQCLMCRLSNCKTMNINREKCYQCGHSYRVEEKK